LAIEGYQVGLLNVLWSLSIEEQFYLVWPAIVWRGSRRLLMAFSLGLAGVSCLMRYYYAYELQDAQVLYFHTLTRLDGIALGSFLALLCEGVPDKLIPFRRWAKLGFVVTGLALGSLIVTEGGLVWAAWFYMGQIVNYLLIAVFFSCYLVIVLSSKEDSLISKFHSSRWMVFFGKYSYGMYLYHVLILDVMYRLHFRQDFFPKVLETSTPYLIAFTLIMVAFTSVLSVVSWELLEKQFLKLKSRFRYRDLE
jgi:peptidoglycan/LPS O-acetylase OafA/YrhL